jgi:hypothetical protein
MATKYRNINQHDILHQHYPDDCCLCKAEARIRELEVEVEKWKKFAKELYDESER